MKLWGQPVPRHIVFRALMSIGIEKSDPLVLLRWYDDVGVDECVGAEPVNRLDLAKPEPAVAHRNEETRPRPVPRRVAERASGDPVAEARRLAENCATLSELKQAIEDFDECALKRSARNTVFADGNPAAPVMFVGEAPGQEEDAQGLPFVGPAGKLLDKMLAAIGRDRNSAYISNIVNWRPPGNRTPSLQEAMICLPFIKRHIQLAGPRIVVLLGGTAAKHLMDTTEGIMRLRGKWSELMPDDFGQRVVAALPTLHPAYLLRQPAHKRLAWQDFLALDSRLRALGETPPGED